VRWHFIGHLQTNKVKDLMCIPNLYAIHSVDSLKLVQELVKYKDSFKGIELNIFLQVNTSLETEKSGFKTMEELEEAVQLVLHTDTPFKMKGLMTMGTLRTENFEIEARRCFQELIKIKKTLQEKYTLVDLKLSMGMSQDYKIAHELEADYVRLGSSLFT
jgi:pyridoxal phosphate enzyme (YggS family)